MLYPVELRAPEKNREFAEEEPGSQIMQKIQKFPAACKIRNDLLTQGHGVDRAKIIHPTIYPPASLREALWAEIDRSGVLRHTSPHNNLTSVHSRNSATGE